MRVVLLLMFTVMPVVFAVDISVVHPKPGAELPIAPKDSTFILGSVQPADAELFINGAAVSTNSLGGFLAWLPVHPDSFTFQITAVSGADTSTLARTVFIPPIWTPTPDSTYIDSIGLRPHADLSLLPGDVVELQFRGAAGGRAAFSLDSLIVDAPMREETPQSPYWGEIVFGDGKTLPTRADSGWYIGTLQIPENLTEPAPVHFQLVANGDTVSRQTAAQIGRWKDEQLCVAETLLPLTVLRTGARKSYYYFLSRGVRLWITGKHGRSYRVRLAGHLDAWIEDYKIRLLPPGAAIPRQAVEAVRVEDQPKATQVRIYTRQPVPYRVIQTSRPAMLTVYFYGVTADIDWIRRDFENEHVSRIQWEQIANDVLEMRIHLSQEHPWGYLAEFDSSNVFTLNIKKTPEIAGWPFSPLRGLTIMLDPGHAPDTGAVSPTGMTEADVNLRLARAVAERLQNNGANVVYTRPDTSGIGLLDRMLLASQTSPDILLSLHHNAVPAGVNPLKHCGTSTYYYFPQSYELAAAMQAELLQSLDRPNFGLFWDNLAMCRLPEMPAVLLEPMFMIHPEAEEMLADDDYYRRCSQAIIRALKSFVRQAN